MTIGLLAGFGLICFGGAIVVAQPAPPSRSPMPLLRVRGDERGEEAIRALGNHLSEVAAHYRKSESELRDIFHRDKSLRLDGGARLHYVCEGLAMPTVSGQTNLSAATGAALYALSQTFLLHSKPGASKVIFLDFDGHTLSGNSWCNAYNGGTNIVAPPWDTDGNPASFGPGEQTTIQQIWFRVVEDFAPFDVDVTTEYPGEAALTRSSAGDNNFGTRALISPIGYKFGNPGGIAYYGAFDDVGDDFKPALIFPENLGYNEKFVAEAISHEVGHNLGLSHDGTTSSAYYSGQGNWGPIMGVPYGRAVSQWSKGDYANANNQEDDLQVITQNGLSFRAVNHGNAFIGATALFGINVTNAGRIVHNTDMNYFSFQPGFGDARITVTPWERGANLHPCVAVYDSQGDIMTNCASTDTGSGPQPVVIDMTTGSGIYYVSVQGTGSGDSLTTGYSDYGSLGQYTLSINWTPAQEKVMAQSPIISTSVIGNNLHLTWPAGLDGWRLEARTNTVASGAGNNWFNIPAAAGTNQLFVPIDRRNGSVLYRLAYP